MTEDDTETKTEAYRIGRKMWHCPSCCSAR